MINKVVESINIFDTEFAVLDFETTGTSGRHNRAIEIGIVRVKNGEILETFQSFINPGTHVPYYITSLTGITNDDVHDAPFFEDLTSQIIDFIGDSILVAHNMPFDYSFLQNEFMRADVLLPKNETLCTLKLARKLYPELKSKSLGNLVQHFGIRHKNVHRALGDAMVTAKLLIKMTNQLQEDQNITKLNELLAYQSASAIKSNFKIIKKKLAIDFANVPSTAGVYLFKDGSGKIVYIGKAKILKKRVSNYFSNTAARKAKEIVRKASGLEYIPTNSELTALILESELIKHHKPPMNSLLKKYSQQYFIKVKQTHDYPSFSSVSKIDFDGNDYFGPYNNRETSKNLIDILHKTYRLRECSDKELNRGKKCYLHDIKRCIAPCIFANKDEYKNELASAYTFLSGENQDAVNKLLLKMRALSDEKKYEEAGEIRDIVNQILNQLNRSSILAEPINKTNALIEVISNQKHDFLLFIEGKVIIQNMPNETENLFKIHIEDYFNFHPNMDENATNKDLGRMKIALSWLVNNRNSFKIHYLKDFSSAEHIFNIIGIE
ncbi:MAG: GIY-YIG nuclease family protein [Bacteroidetes bacterium]|nr:GIY-YIG nuclease family protein [Bacteroidota bacterium]MBU1117184.1 GIY-YIG nuclease family protein [Bacteroidota bacterium]MBU1797883.1 GIY-YIG nuclease family protein [Bacteroidota bacterium]